MVLLGYLEKAGVCLLTPQEVLYQFRVEALPVLDVIENRLPDQLRNLANNFLLPVPLIEKYHNSQIMQQGFSDRAEFVALGHLGVNFNFFFSKEL